MEEVRDRGKKWYDKNAIKREFQQGDAVLVLTLNQPHKLAPQWKGPAFDTEEITELSELEEDFPYMLTDPNVFDFREIVENNQLKERLGDEQIMQLGKLLVKFPAQTFQGNPI
ncbi:retrovirus-related Pol polyprotein from transposon 17.6 [Trichonephila inaurata madagascariensis]|uniref:Retrovirus-related Pol polyprotein from transposon 17.6 n=1 Tax=Trichonephila inaurata madagascariensis TaxID=2747483 RepID=A0A8X7C8Q2_9ARAC|nr:retrovirus-related Pol polyprotein from transposon 17.6 [Trichonephila inaurata madagascariensis]